MKYINCIVCLAKEEAKRIDKQYCKICYREHQKILRRKRDRTPRAKARYQRYRATKEYKEKALARYHEMDENKRRARYSVTNAVRDGRLKRPKNCETCYRIDMGVERSQLEAHHHAGYSKENWLKIQWLCVQCHKRTQEVFLGK